jgi:hypothetical protein
VRVTPGIFTIFLKEVSLMALRQTRFISNPRTWGFFSMLFGTVAISFLNCGGDNPAAPVLAPSNLTYTHNPAFYTVGIQISQNVPASTGGAVSSYSVAPALPAGLAINRETGTISGTPSIGAPSAVYTVTATNSAGSTSAALTIAIDNALALESPTGGESFSFQDSITVRWTGNPDSIGNPPLQSFTMEFSLDTGKNWIKMSYPTESVLDNSDGIYQISWIGLDTTFLNPVTFDPLTKSDFLNKGVIIHIISYPPKSITRQSGYIFFHE